MKILYLIRTMDIGGAERFTYNLANHFNTKFEKVAIYCSSGIFVKELESKNIKFFLSRFAKRRGLRYTIKIFFELIKILSRESFDIIHCQQRIFLILVNLIYRNKNRPRIIYTANNFFDDWIQRFLLADLFVGVSPTITKSLVDTCKQQKARIVNINYGVPMQDRLEKLFTSSFKIGFVGRIVREKGVYTIFKAMKNVLNYDKNVKVSFIGDGKEKLNLEKLVRNNSLEEFFAFLEPQSYLKNLYTNLDLLLLPTEMKEGLPISILEAASFGVPTLAINSGGIQDFIIDDVTGYLISTADTKILVGKIKEIIKNKILHSTIKTNCVSKVNSEFSLESMLNGYDNIYFEK